MSAADLSREAWLQLRKQSIGASEAAAACGEDPKVSPMELVCRKRGELPEEDLGGIEAVQWGLLLEPAIVAESARRAGLQLLNRSDMEEFFAEDARTELVGFVDGAHPFLRSRERPWQTATLDGLGIDPASRDVVGIEAKNQGAYHASAWDDEEGRAPDKFRLQVAHQLAVAPRLSCGILAGLVGGNSLRSVRLERVRIVPVIDAVVAIEESVWRCVTSGATPTLAGPTDSVRRALRALHPDDNGTSVILPESLLDVVVRYREAKYLGEEYSALANSLQLEIEAAIGSASYGVLPDGSGTFSLLTTERDGYTTEVGPTKYRQLRFKKSKAPKAKTARK